jgi:hypothetical protein
MCSKLENAVERRYLEEGGVASLVNLFGVLKGVDDIHMIYDAIMLGLNVVLCPHGFPYPPFLPC